MPKPKHSQAAIQDLSKTLDVEPPFLTTCLEEALIEVEETGGRLNLGNGTALKLRRLQRLCLTFNIDLPVALLLLEVKS